MNTLQKIVMMAGVLVIAGLGYYFVYKPKSVDNVKIQSKFSYAGNLKDNSDGCIASCGTECVYNCALFGTVGTHHVENCTKSCTSACRGYCVDKSDYSQSDLDKLGDFLVGQN